MVYSTCTLNLEENEQILEWALEQLQGLKLLPIDLSLKEAEHGLTPNTRQAMKILPSKNMEGFFVAKLLKQV